MDASETEGVMGGSRMSRSKFKTHKASAKRFKVTGSGKIVRQHSGTGHNTGKKRENNRREARKWETIEGGYAKKARRSLGL